MSVTGDIAASWRGPRALIRAKLAKGPREDGAVVTLLGACILIFVAQWPALAREAALDPEQPLQARLLGALLAVLFFLPLLAYAIAGFSHFIALRLGAKGSYFSSRLALFQALLAISPLMLLHGLIRGFAGPGLGSTVPGVAVMGAFLYLWLSMLIEAESG
jgi:hypothetical protein